MVQSDVPGAFISRLLSCGVEVVRARLISDEKRWREEKRRGKEGQSKVPSGSSLVAMVAGCAGMCLGWQCPYLWHQGTWGNNVCV